MSPSSLMIKAAVGRACNALHWQCSRCRRSYLSAATAAMIQLMLGMQQVLIQPKQRHCSLRQLFCRQDMSSNLNGMACFIVGPCIGGVLLEEADRCLAPVCLSSLLIMHCQTLWHALDVNSQCFGGSHRTDIQLLC